MVNWSKYAKEYNKKWEDDARLKPWLAPNSDDEVRKGKPQAYCSWCECPLRAHLSDLVAHSLTVKHKKSAKKYDRRSQPSLHNYGRAPLSDLSKVTDLKLAMYVATHTSVRSVDHLCELLKELGKGSPLANVRLHRTKCSKLISEVISPAFLTELVEDIGDSPYSLIIDECTDKTVSKFMGICVRYHSKKKKRFVTDFLGLVQVVSCTGKDLAQAAKEYLATIGLPLKNCDSMGTDGAANMCGSVNSMYTHLKKDAPQLELFKCVCHSLDKCAEHAFKKMPSELTDLLTESYNYFAHSVKRWDDYVKYYQTLNEGKTPKRLMSLSTTRWLVWLPVADLIMDQWYELRGFFAMAGEGPKGDPKARSAAKLFTSTNLLYLTFLSNILRGVQKVNKAFEATEADVTKVYSDLRSQILSLAGRILKPHCMVETARPGMLRSEEARIIKTALLNPSNLLPTDRVGLGERFTRVALSEKVPEQELNDVRLKCGGYIFTLTSLLLDKLPSNLDSVSKVRFLVPRLVLARTARPTFSQLPTELAGTDPELLDQLENQWRELGTLPITEICDDFSVNDDIDNVDIAHFWSCVLELKNVAGERPFKALALMALRALTMPISNAVVERAFSVMSCIKCRRRNRMQLRMLDSLMRVRIHLKVDGLCCKNFVPTQSMLRSFTSEIYDKFHAKDVDGAGPSRARERHDAAGAEDAGRDPDDPEPMDLDGEIIEIEELQDVDYVILEMIDSVNDNDNELLYFGHGNDNE